MRKRVITGLLALTASLALALPAWAADPAYYIDTNNGRVAEVEDVGDCTVSVAVDLHRGYSSDIDPTAEAVSGHVRVSLGSGAVRAQVDNIRVGSTAAAPAADVNDFYPSARSTARNNTGAVSVSGNVVNLWKDDNDNPALGGDLLDPPYEGPYVRDGLNSAFDFSPNVSTLRAYGDWIPTRGDLDPGAGTLFLGREVQVRAYGTVRCSSGDLGRWTILSNPTSTDSV